MQKMAKLMCQRVFASLWRRIGIKQNSARALAGCRDKRAFDTLERRIPDLTYVERLGDCPDSDRPMIQCQLIENRLCHALGISARRFGLLFDGDTIKAKDHRETFGVSAGTAAYHRAMRRPADRGPVPAGTCGQGQGLRLQPRYPR